jgi:integrase
VQLPARIGLIEEGQELLVAVSWQTDLLDPPGGTLSAAVRWGWIPYNPMPSVKPPAKKRPQPRPPSPEQMAHIVEAAWKASNEWGLYVWLSAITGARRGEVIALQWNDIDWINGILQLDENYVRAANGMILKDTKTHQMRRVSIDKPTVELLRKHKDDCTHRMFLLGLPLTDDTWLFSAQPDLSKPRDPSAVTRRYSRLGSKLGIDTQLKQLRHYSATEQAGPRRRHHHPAPLRCLGRLRRSSSR